jgi:hypothetical protein
LVSTTNRGREVVIDDAGTALHLELRDLEYPHDGITRDFRINIPKAEGGTTAYVGFTVG